MVNSTSTHDPHQADAPVKHLLVSKYLRDQILRHKLPPRHMLESESELCERFGISRGPVRQALAALEQEGLIYRQARRGSFVAERPTRSGQDSATAERSTNLWMFPVGTLGTSNFMIPLLLRGLEQGAGAANAALIVSALVTDAKAHPLIQQGSVTGLFACAGEPRVIYDSAFAHLPKVWLMTRLDTHQEGWDAVGPDNEAIGRMAAEYLIGKGCKHLAFLNPMVTSHSALNRLPGFLAQAHRRGATIQIVDDTSNTELSDTGDNKFFANRLLELMVDRLLKLDPRPTGVFAPSDYVTAAMLPMLQKRGIVIGRDLQLISCNNDQSVLASLDPRPVTIDINCEEIGRQAARVMARRVADEAGFPWVNVLVPPTLVLPDAGD